MFCFLGHRWGYVASGVFSKNGDMQGAWVADRCSRCGRSRTREYLAWCELPYGINPVTGERCKGGVPK